MAYLNSGIGEVQACIGMSMDPCLPYTPFYSQSSHIPTELKAAFLANEQAFYQHAYDDVCATALLIFLRN